MSCALVGLVLLAVLVAGVLNFDWVQERLLIKQGDWSHARTSEVR